jgi:hypothetical protein
MPVIVIIIPTIFLIVYCSRNSIIPTINSKINDTDFKTIVLTDGVLYNLSNCINISVEQTVKNETSNKAIICVYEREQQLLTVLTRNLLSNKYSYKK